MDATREKMCVFENYQVTDEEWELIKANFAYQEQNNPSNKAYSKEYIINALSRLTECVAEQDQSSLVFERQEINTTFPLTRRAKKDVILKYLNLFQKVLPTWYKLPPMLADDFQMFILKRRK